MHNPVDTASSAETASSMAMQEPLVLLPGMMCDARLFTPQISAFSFQRAVLVAPLIGKDSIVDLAKQVLENAPPRFALAGLSMGGIVAMEIIRQAPERVTRVALMDTNPLADAPENSKVREAQIDQVRNGQLNTVMREEMKPKYLSDGPNLRNILDLCMSMAQTLGPDVFVGQSKAVQQRPDQCETLRSISVPTLVLCGGEERLCPVSLHELMRDLIPDAQLSVIPEAGHLPTLEQPLTTNAALDEWLKT